MIYRDLPGLVWGLVTKLMAGSLLPPAGLSECGQFEANVFTDRYFFIWVCQRIDSPDKWQSESKASRGAPWKLAAKYHEAHLYTTVLAGVLRWSPDDVILLIKNQQGLPIC